jgi:hypothetical protein
MPNQNSTLDPLSSPVGQIPEPIADQNNSTVTTVSGSQQPNLIDSMPVHNDLPPLPDYMTQNNPSEIKENIGSTTTEDSSPQPSENLTGSAAPPDLPPMVSSPKKKFGGKKIIATILGIFLLVGGIGAGIVLTQQQQLFQQKAEGTTYPGTYPVYKNGASSGEIAGYRYIAVPGVFEAALLRAAGGNSFDMALLTTGYYGMTEDQVRESATHLSNGETWVPAGTGCVGTPESEDQNSPHYCHDWHWTNCLHPGTGLNGVGCDVVGTTNPTEPPSDNPPTDSPNGPVADCQNVKAYSSTWTLLSSTDLSALESGTAVNFCVNGVASSGVFDKAKFIINDTELAETTTKRPSSTDYCQSYTIPEGTTTFNISAQIHHETLGWK